MYISHDLVKSISLSNSKNQRQNWMKFHKLGKLKNTPVSTRRSAKLSDGVTWIYYLLHLNRNTPMSSNLCQSCVNTLYIIVIDGMPSIVKKANKSP